jgi:hypothetical protein
MQIESKESKVLDLLNSLGSDSIEVARNLRTQKIKGIPYDAHSCPVATFLKSKFPGWKITTFRTITGYNGKIPPSEWTIFTIPTPPAVYKFMVAFDKGQFPDLIA